MGRGDPGLAPTVPGVELSSTGLLLLQLRVFLFLSEHDHRSGWPDWETREGRMISQSWCLHQRGLAPCSSPSSGSLKQDPVSPTEASCDRLMGEVCQGQVDLQPNAAVLH